MNFLLQRTKSNIPAAKHINSSLELADGRWSDPNRWMWDNALPQSFSVMSSEKRQEKTRLPVAVPFPRRATTINHFYRRTNLYRFSFPLSLFATTIPFYKYIRCLLNIYLTLIGYFSKNPFFNNLIKRACSKLHN